MGVHMFIPRDYESQRRHEAQLKEEEVRLKAFLAAHRKESINRERQKGREK